MNVAEDHPLLPYVSKFGKMPDGDIAAQATSELGRVVSARDVGKYRKYLGIEPFYPQRTLFETAPSPAADQDQIATSGTAVDGMEVPVPPSAGADVVDADDAFRRDAPKSKTSRVIPIDGIRTDGGTQARGSMNEDTVETYAEAMAEGVTFPPVVVYLDDQGDAWLADGFHRLAAAWKAGHT
ncbi:MAG TPA: ParB/Srx family N-terminal domain-containing protein, partial [Myxococcota bacterium]|nr:ParB/Srx family N-terminal domain-containing protein [Myxococcota bacterium]